MDLQHLGLDPAALDPAPPRMTGDAGLDRIGDFPKPCTLCGQPARFTRIVATVLGPRWLDRCRACYLTYRPGS